MFLTLAYSLFIFQVIIISLLILPIGIRIKHNATNFVATKLNNFHLKTIFAIIVIVIVGLFIENLIIAFRYDALRHDLTNALSNHVISSSSKHEILLKLFGAQRNLYLTFTVNFNWIVMYTIHKYIQIIHRLESLIENNKTE